MGIRNRFTDHPAQVGETYFEHQKVALRYSRQLFVASMQAAVHSVLPWCCCTSASDRIHEMHGEITAGARGRLAQGAPHSANDPATAVTV
ncbi:MAG: DUF6356 family protein [Actinomycetota bacterium]